MLHASEIYSSSWNNFALHDRDSDIFVQCYSYKSFSRVLESSVEYVGPLDKGLCGAKGIISPKGRPYIYVAFGYIYFSDNLYCVSAVYIFLNV